MSVFLKINVHQGTELVAVEHIVRVEAVVDKAKIVLSSGKEVYTRSSYPAIENLLYSAGCKVYEEDD